MSRSDVTYALKSVGYQPPSTAVFLCLLVRYNTFRSAYNQESYVPRWKVAAFKFDKAVFLHGKAGLYYGKLAYSACECNLYSPRFFFEIRYESIPLQLS